jgi:hypothetical protein
VKALERGGETEEDGVKTDALAPLGRADGYILGSPPGFAGWVGCASVESNKAVLRVDQLREQRGVRAGLVILPLLAHSSCRGLRPRRRPKLELQLHSSLALAPEPGSRRQPAKADQLTPRTKRSRATDSEPTGWP